MKAIAYYAMGLVGYEILEANDEQVTYRYIGVSSGKPAVQHAKVRHTNSGRAYFLASGRRIHLDECLRTNI